MAGTRQGTIGPTARDPGGAGPAPEAEPPLCVFGPGGSFRTAWPPGPLHPPPLHAARVRSGPLGDVRRAPRTTPGWRSRWRQVVLAAGQEARRNIWLRWLSAREVLPLCVFGPQGLSPFAELCHAPNQEARHRRDPLPDAPSARNPYADPRRPAQRWPFPAA